MFCPKCGRDNPDNVTYCANCGEALFAWQKYAPRYQYQPPQQQPPYQNAENKSAPGKGLAIASMILGLATLNYFCYWFLSIPSGIVALILGISSCVQASSAGRKTHGMAVAGIICGSIGLFLGMIFFFFEITGLYSFFDYLDWIFYY